MLFRHTGSPEDSSPHAVPHYEIPWFDEMIDFPRGVKVAGAGYPFYMGDMSKLVRALINFLEEASFRGYEEIHSPIVVNASSATATGQLPDKEGQMYCDQNEGLYLIPTAEVPVTNFFRNDILSSEKLPIKKVAYTCFRREAGSWGKDVRGLNRLHQFDKVELVKWTHPENSDEELELLRKDAENLLQKLGLHYRVLLICSGDIGFPHSKQFDLEVWAAGQKRWLEVSSCSNFTDFQARRANIRYREDGEKPKPVHTLNGSALAIPRVLAAILENFLHADGKVKVPDCLKNGTPMIMLAFLQLNDYLMVGTFCLKQFNCIRTSRVKFGMKVPINFLELNKEERWCFACSGGADSIFGLLNIRASYQKCQEKNFGYPF